MKIIPKDELITLLQMDNRSCYSISILSDIFEKFGDDYYTNPDNHSELVLTNSNNYREMVIRNYKEFKEFKESAAKTQQGGFNAGQCVAAFPE
jgi:hypothetical protein